MKNQNLTHGNILAALLKFAIPVFFALFLQAMYGAVDLVIVGKFAEVADQSGVASGSMLMSIPTTVVAGLSMGITVFIGEAIGAGDKKKAGDGIGAGICLFLTIAIVLTLVIIPNSKKLAILMHAPQEALTQTSQYILVCGVGVVFILAYNVLGAVFRGIGDSTTPLITVAIACVVNIVGDLILVAGCHLGAAGAAAATVLAQALSVIISLMIIRKRELPFTFSKSSIRFHGTYMKKILFIGVPVGLQELLVSLSFLFIQTIVNSMGLTASAGVGVAEKVCAFLMLVGSAFMQSMSAFVAQNNGAGQHARAKKALSYGIVSAFVAGAAMGGLAFFGGSALASIFSNDGEVIAAAHSYLKAYAIDCLLTAVFFCFVGYFNGCEKSFFVMMQGLIGAFCVRIPVVYLMSRIQNTSLFMIGLGTPASSLVQTILCIGAFFYYEKRWKNR